MDLSQRKLYHEVTPTSEQERYRDLRRRGYGEDRILVWQKYYLGNKTRSY